MPGYTTDVRNATVPIPWELQQNGQAPQKGVFNGSFGPGPGKQSTTSWRTNGDDSSVDAANYRDFLTAMRKDKSILMPHDTGHTFLSTKRTTLLSHEYVRLQRGATVYTGPLVLQDSTNTGTGSSPVQRSAWRDPSPVDLNVYGQKAIRQTIPTNSVANLSLSLAEILREGVPALIGSKLLGSAGLQQRSAIVRNAGDEYLNSVFGWAPLVREVTALARAARESSRIIQQYSRDSDRFVRRKMRFPTELTNSEVDLGGLNGNNMLPNFIPGQLLYGGSVKMLTRTTRDVWFSGAYQYSLSSDPSILGQAARIEQQANHLLGSRITPAVLWNLAPWSWLSDWFLNVGSVLQTASSLQSDGLVIRYGYLMCTTTVDRIISASDVQSLSTWNPKAFVTTYRSTRKERVRSTPFGFGLTGAQITESQWAILGALGLTKAPRTLW